MYINSNTKNTNTNLKTHTIWMKLGLHLEPLRVRVLSLILRKKLVIRWLQGGKSGLQFLSVLMQVVIVKLCYQ